jgi:hypothetical protein
MSTVAGAVVTIDGDSSGLVGALQKGEKGLADVKQEADKLSDQLREVTDAADVAAGALVKKLGGPGAIQAIAGVTAGLAAAKQVSDAFLDSAENLFKSFGDEGVKVWDDVEKSLFAIKGAFAEAVLGGGSMEEMGERLKIMFEAVKDVVDFLLIPVRAFASLLWLLRGETDNAAEATDRLNQSMIETGEAQAKAAAAMAARTQDINQLYTQALNDLGYQQIAAQEASLRSADAYQSGFQDLLGQAATKAAKILSEGKIYVQDYRDAVEEVVLGLEDSPEAMMKAYGALAAAGLEEEIQKLEVLRQAREQALAKSRGELQQAATSGGGGAPPAMVDAMLKVTELADGTLKILTDAEAAALEAAAEAAGSNMTTVIEIKRSEYEQLAQMKADHDFIMLGIQTATDNARLAQEAKVAAERADSAAKAKAELEAAQAEADAYAAERADGRLKMDKKTAQQVYEVTVATNAKMIAASIAANKSMSEIARAAIGNIISALGDKAMMEAGEMAAAGNFVQATAMAAAGTTAYAVAATLGAQKKPNAGPPTERQQPVQNYAYNLRIDAAFADSESISRRFAQMQEGARQRGLIAGAA